MGKGRKASPGTHEARDYVSSGAFEKVLETVKVSVECKARIVKAVKFGLGIK